VNIDFQKLRTTQTLTSYAGPIEKGANDGQAQYAKDITTALRAAVTVKSLVKGIKTKGKGGRRKKDSTDTSNVATDDNTNSTAKATSEPNWGLFEPLRGPLGPVASLVSPGIIIGILSFLILFMWWRQSRHGAYSTRGGALGVPGLATPQRIAAYEEMWRGEESELWQWLEDRVGLDGSVPDFLTGVPGGAEKRETKKRKESLARQKAIEMEKRLVDEEMGDRQMIEAIRVTKERLKTLEDAVKRRSGHLSPDDAEAPPPPYERKEL
jgi:hypothetical protein